MPNYADAKIYTIRCRSNDLLIYVGSTTQKLTQRLAKHRSDCKGGSCITLYSHIVDNDWSNWYIELYEYYPCNNRTELEKREGEVIREIGSINKCIAGRTRKKWREDNAEYFKEYNKKRREDNANIIKEKAKIQICCNICGAFSSKNHLVRHQKTKKCTDIKSKNYFLCV